MVNIHKISYLSNFVTWTFTRYTGMTVNKKGWFLFDEFSLADQFWYPSFVERAMGESEKWHFPKKGCFLQGGNRG